jgi:hypothetical protein
MKFVKIIIDGKEYYRKVADNEERADEEAGGEGKGADRVEIDAEIDTDEMSDSERFRRDAKQLFEKMGNDEVAEMFTLRKKGTFTTRSNSYQIFIFAKLFNSLFNQWGMPNKTIRSSKNQISYSKQFLISRLIYLTRISDNEEFYYEPTTIKGYISRYKNKGIKADTTNRIYRNFDKGE